MIVGVCVIVKVRVRVDVIVALIVQVGVIEFVFHGVQETVSVGGQVIVRVGEYGFTQQIVRFT